MSRKVRARTVNTRVTETAAELLGKLAVTLYLQHVDAHRKVRLRGPNNRMAVDYLIYISLTDDEKRMYSYQDKENLYVRVLKIERGADKNVVEKQS